MVFKTGHGKSKSKRKNPAKKKLVDSVAAKRKAMMEKKLKDMPMSCRNIFKNACTKNSKKTAIQAMCLECTGYDRKYIEKCPSLACPLWLQRPYQKGE